MPHPTTKRTTPPFVTSEATDTQRYSKINQGTSVGCLDELLQELLAQKLCPLTKPQRGKTVIFQNEKSLIWVNSLIQLLNTSIQNGFFFHFTPGLSLLVENPNNVFITDYLQPTSYYSHDLPSLSNILVSPPGLDTIHPTKDNLPPKDSGASKKSTITHCISVFTNGGPQFLQMAPTTNNNLPRASTSEDNSPLCIKALWKTPGSLFSGHLDTPWVLQLHYLRLPKY